MGTSDLPSLRLYRLQSWNGNFGTLHCRLPSFKFIVREGFIAEGIQRIVLLVVGWEPHLDHPSCSSIFQVIGTVLEYFEHFTDLEKTSAEISSCASGQKK